MNRRSIKGRITTTKAIGLVILLTIPLLSVFTGSLPSGAANLQGYDAEATISALETEVAELQAQVATAAPTATSTDGLGFLFASASPTATPAPRPTVSTEPQMLADGLDLLYYYTIDAGSYVTFLGEVRNTTDRWLDSPYFEITVFDVDGNILTSESFSSVLETIGPGETVPFEEGVSDIDEWDHEEIRACDWSTDSDHYVDEGYGESPTLQLQDVKEIEKSPERLEIEGKILNSGDAPVEEVKVTAFVYLPDGRYAGHTNAYIDVPIPPGKTARFTLSGKSFDIPGFDLPETGDNYTYRLWVGTQPSITVHFC